MKIIGLYSGTSKLIGPKRSASAIFKTPQDKVMVNELGIVGDVQANTKVHGGPEKALHQYALSSYEKLIKRYPLLHKTARPGSIGENLCATEMSDDSVCIGDIYQLGNISVQVTSPRIPCWKIDVRLNQPDLHKYVASSLSTGWYYRVLQVGELCVGAEVSLTERPNPQLSIAKFMQIVNGDIVDADYIAEAAEAQGLDPQWQGRLETKLKHLL
jgi:MOSC domain-containing protein YiiM